jgi:DNA polymerase-3 subunit delta'
MHPWNEPILESLKRRVDRLPHALLIHGPQGVGKLKLAERLAQLLLCEAADPGRKPCDACDGCRWYLGGNHPDFRRVEPEALAPPVETEGEEAAASARKGKPSQDIKVDQVRELAGFLNIGSHRGQRRVALVHPADEMNDHAANALLKGLEEPPGGAMFVLVSHRPMRLLATIRSRCVAVPVPPPPRQVALEWLSGAGIKDAERWLAYAGGAPLRALDYATNAETVDRLLSAIRGRGQVVVDDRKELEVLAEALQKVALDQALSAFGVPPKYAVAPSHVSPTQARAWLAFARQMGRNRDLARHPLNTRLFAAEMLAGMPPSEAKGDL